MLLQPATSTHELLRKLCRTCRHSNRIQVFTEAVLQKGRRGHGPAMDSLVMRKIQIWVQRLD